MSLTTNLHLFKKPFSKENLNQWPNFQTIPSTLCIFTNLVSEAVELTDGKKLVVNLPFRTISIITAASQKDVVKVAFDVVAFAALFFPYGTWIALGIDLTAEAINIHRSHQISQRSLSTSEWNDIFRGSSLIRPDWIPAPSHERANPNQLQGAQKILGLENVSSYTKETVQDRLSKGLETLNKRKENPQISRPLATFFEGLIDDEKKAAATLLANLNSQETSQSKKFPT